MRRSAWMPSAGLQAAVDHRCDKGATLIGGEINRLRQIGDKGGAADTEPGMRVTAGFNQHPAFCCPEAFEASNSASASESL